MFDTIRKRDGRIVPFQTAAITKAIAAAGAASGEFDDAIAQSLTRRVLAVAAATIDGQPEVEAIQDTVEQVLLASPYSNAAKAFIIYREQHATNRRLSEGIKADLVESYLDRLDWQVAENANMAYSLQGLNNYVASEVSRTYWLERIYPKEVCDAHTNGDFHIHDLNLLAVYCVGWDLVDLLSEGFTGAFGKVESKPAKHFRTALGQMVNFFYTLQGEAAGAQAFSSVDTYLAPFIRADGLDYTEVKQALQEFVFNLNVPTRVGFQTPFTNLTLDVDVPASIADEPVIIGGKRVEGQCYRDFQEEMDQFNRAFLEVMEEGDAKGRVFTFPIPTYNVTDSFDFEDPRHQPLWRATARYGIPYFSNFINSDLDPSDARSMCCRLRLDTRTLAHRGGGLFGANPLTGSIGVVTLNLPRVGYLADDEESLFARIDHLMDMARDSLELKRKTLERLTDRNLYPYSKFYLRHIKEAHGCYWRNHFGTIGLVGLNEAMVNFLGEGIDSEAGRALGLRVLEHMRERLVQYQEASGNLYNLEATPAEGTSYRLARADKRAHPAILVANECACRDEGAEPFYTNSSHLPVGHSDDVMAVLDHQDDFQCSYTGGTVLHAFAGEAMADPQAVKRFVQIVCRNHRLPYFTFTPTFSVCPEHGYLQGEQHNCPQCGRESEIYSRVVGYLRPVQQWNAGKQAEWGQRQPYAVAEAAVSS
ncbi:MAG: ribonucleoside triphosphate reductase [Planctomycetota bacterium]|nr:MAG: ribonucleoside triphosphate reductase [Planctomycetota bacterium]